MTSPYTMSELDLYSDSEWLDISSGRESDDNVSLSDQDSDHDAISSVPISRRSSFSTESSMGGDVEAWEGFVSDSGEDAVDQPTGMYPMPPSSASGAEPIAVGCIPNVTAAIDPAVAEEDKLVKEALEQSFVGTLTASRSSAVGLHNSSTQTSIRDIRLSFPDPLTSSRDELNGSYEDVTSSVPSDVGSPAVNADESPASSLLSLPLCDQGHVSTPEVQRHEDNTVHAAGGTELDVVLYGTSSSIKWQFVETLIQKAIVASGHDVINNLEDGFSVQSLQFVKQSSSHLKFFKRINVYDRTNESTVKVEMDDGNTSDRRSLAIIYLPTATLPVITWHDTFLPVLVPSSPMGEGENTVMRQAAEDDWDLLAVPASRTLQLGSNHSLVFDSDEVSDLDPLYTYDLLCSIGHESKKCSPSRPLTEKIKSVNAVTLFSVMSVVMGFAFNTMFLPQTPSPTPTVNAPSSSSQLWQVVAQPNHSVTEPSTSCNQSKDCGVSSSLEQVALSVYDGRTSVIAVTPPASSLSLTIPSTSTAVADFGSSSFSSNCRDCTKPALRRPHRASTDLVIRSPITSLSQVIETASSLSAVPSESSKGLTTTSSVASGQIMPKAGNGAILAPSTPNHFKSVSEAFEATTKVLTEALGNDFADFVSAADGLLASFIEQTDSVIQQSKGKARELGEQIQNLNEEVMFRNERAKKRAKELKRKGEDIVRKTREEFKERTKKAKERARELKQAVIEVGDDALRNHGTTQTIIKEDIVDQEAGEQERCKKRQKKHKQRKQMKLEREMKARIGKENCRHPSKVRWTGFRACRHLV